MTNRHSRSKILPGVLFILSAAVSGVAAGAIATIGALRSADDHRAIRNGAWATSENFGAKDAIPRLRAVVAMKGLFALNKSETIYYIAEEDDDGRKLDSNCDYIISGVDIPANWWSVTLYGADYFLVDNPADRYSFNMRNLDWSDDGTFSLTVAPEKQSGDWLPTGGRSSGEIFSLALRVYNPAPEVYRALDTVSLPSVRKGRCS